ncbi:MAG TPA: SIMPL domain-containing protein, partial [Trueperaceae bacterium]|nr:SIMPL domain-containing protein [Trueperaceae bacterium]
LTWNRVAVVLPSLSVGEVLAAVVEAGANEVGGIVFTLSDPGALAAEARRMALADARQRASGLAEAAGVSLGAPISISELDAMPYAAYRQAAVMDSVGSSVATGQLAITVTVQVTYAIEAVE